MERGRESGSSTPVDAGPDESYGLAHACIVCSTPLAGVPSIVFRLAGIRRSPRNPNLCTRCNTHAEEGRIVELTVLFADVSSFTEMTHELGPQRTHELVDAFLQMATQELVRHDGFLDKYIGDAVMAFFNAPVRRTDHAAQAVAAAQAIMAGVPRLRERFSIDLDISVGIASGWARLGRLGSQEGKDYTALGDVVNLAARLQSQAGVGEILVDGPVYEAAADHYPDSAEEQLWLKGFKDATAAHRLNAARDRPAPLRGEGSRGGRALGLGGMLFAILGAPCAAATLIGPAAVSVGFVSGIGASSALWALGDAPIRYPILALATLGALANLYTVWHASRLRREMGRGHGLLAMTRLERQQTLFLMSTSILALGVVGFEFYAHDQLVGQMPMKMPMK